MAYVVRMGWFTDEMVWKVHSIFNSISQLSILLGNKKRVQFFFQSFFELLFDSFVECIVNI